MPTLASLDDINTHLEETRLKATDAEVSLLQLDALRVVKGVLANTFSPATLALWTDPESTPEYIRSVSGRFIASKYYARKLSGSTDDVPEYAQWLYDQAIADLNAVATGAVILEEVDEEVTTGSSITEANFNFPEEPKFTMTMEL